MVNIVLRDSATETILTMDLYDSLEKGEKFPSGEISHVNEMYR